MEGLPGPKGEKGDPGPQGPRGLKGDRVRCERNMNHRSCVCVISAFCHEVAEDCLRLGCYTARSVKEITDTHCVVNNPEERSSRIACMFTLKRRRVQVLIQNQLQGIAFEQSYNQTV
jgi:hypothetical protein